MAGLREKLTAPETAAEAVGETGRLNRERHASGAGDRRALAQVGKRIAATIAIIEAAAAYGA